MFSENAIAKASPMIPIREIVRKLGIGDEYADPYGRYKAKITYDYFRDHSTDDPGKLLVFASLDSDYQHLDAQNCAIGIADAMTWNEQRKCSVVFSQPASGPLFNVAPKQVGDGFCQLVPDDEITTHFTGDMYAFLAAIKLMFMLPEKKKNTGFNSDPAADSAKGYGFHSSDMKAHWDGLTSLKSESDWLFDLFRIPAVIELQSAFNLAEDLSDLKQRIAKVTIDVTDSGERITVGAMKGEDKLCALLEEAFRPNVVQTIEGYPAFVHGISLQGSGLYGGSIHALKAALALDDYVITEGGALSDGSLQRNLDIRFRGDNHIRPARIVIVVSLGALKKYAGIDPALQIKPGQITRAAEKLTEELACYKKMYGQKPLVILSRGAKDEAEELKEITDHFDQSQTDYCFSDTTTLGSPGGQEAARFLNNFLLKRTAFYENHRLKDDYRDAMIRMVRDETGIQNVYLSEKAAEKIAVYQK